MVLHIVDDVDSQSLSSDTILREMFAARKRVFVDLLRWDVPVLAGSYEVDQFDDPHATYLVLANEDGRHLGSARLLSTVRPHILSSVFPQLCEGEIPQGENIYEITRFCLDSRENARRRLATRIRLVTALIDYALAHGITGYTGVAEMGWFSQILAFGWHCMPLGLPQVIDGSTLVGLSIKIDGQTRAKCASAGYYLPADHQSAAARHAA